MNKLNKLLATVILGHLFSAYAAASERESADCPLRVAANPPEGELVRVPPGTPEAVTVRDSKLDPIQLPAQSMSELLFYRSLPSKRSYLKEVRDFLNDKTQYITLSTPKALGHYNYWDDLRAIAVVDFRGCCSLRSIGSRAFMDSGLEEILFPSCLEKIRERAFCSCSSLRLIDLRGCCSLRSIGDYAFRSSSLEEILLPTHISGYIGHSAFSGCRRLRKAILPTVGEYVGGSIFSGCPSLRLLTLSDRFTSRETLKGHKPIPWFSGSRSPFLSEVRFMGMDTSKLPPDLANTIVRRDWLGEEFRNRLTMYSRSLGRLLSPAAWNANLRPKLQGFVGSPEYQTLLEMPDETAASKLFRDNLRSIFTESLSEATQESEETINTKQVSGILGRVAPFPFPAYPTTVHSETVSFFDHGTRPLHAP